MPRQQNTLEKPTIFVTVRDMGFIFHVDPTARHNYIDPCFIEFFESINTPTPLEERMPEEEFNEMMRTRPFDTPLYFDKAVYEIFGEEEIVCFDGTKKVCKIVRFYYEYEGASLSSVFYIDDSICKFNEETNSNIAAILKDISFIEK